MPILPSCVSGIQKCYLFYVGQLKMPETHFKKVTSPPLPVFYHCTAKKKDIAFEIWYVCFMYVALKHKCRFLDKS